MKWRKSVEEFLFSLLLNQKIGHRIGIEFRQKFVNRWYEWCEFSSILKFFHIGKLMFSTQHKQCIQSISSTKCHIRITPKHIFLPSTRVSKAIKSWAKETYDGDDLPKKENPPYFHFNLLLHSPTLKISMDW